MFAIIGIVLGAACWFEWNNRSSVARNSNIAVVALTQSLRATTSPPVTSTAVAVPPLALAPPPSTSTVLADPNVFCVNITVSSEIGVGNVIVKVHKDWAPLGAQQFSDLVDERYFEGAKFFRVLKQFMAQIGINKDPAVTKQWRSRVIKDDPVTQSNKRGAVTFATSGPNSRSSQIFFNTVNNKFLDQQGFAPFAEVVDGMQYVDGLYSGYGEGAPAGKGPAQGKANNQGNKYLDEFFPKLSFVVATQRMAAGSC